MRWRKTLALLLAVGLVVSLFGVAGCGTSTKKPETPAAEEPVKGGTFIFGDMTEPAYIDPYNAQESSGVNVESTVFDSLVAFGAVNPLELLPAAADTWEPNADASVWTFKLNPNAKFHNGQPVTAQDFVYAWNRIVDPKGINTITKKADPSILGYHLESVKGYQEVQEGKATTLSGLKAVDDLTFEVTLSYPYADFEYVVGHPALAPVPKDAVENGVSYTDSAGKTTTVPFGEMPIGNGPFKMSEPWKHEQYIKTEAFADYYGDKPYLDGVEFRIFKDTNTEYLEFQGGNLDFSIIGDGQIEAAQAQYGVAPDGYTPEPGKQCVLGPSLGVYYIDMLKSDPYLKNIELRRAVSLAINRQAICDVVYQGTRVPADGFIPPGTSGYVEGAWPDSKYDVEAAKAALEKAGYPGGKGLPKLELAYNADGAHKPIIELIASDLATIGVQAQITPYADWGAYLKAWQAKKVQMGRMTWIADYPTGDNFLYSIFKSDAGNNWGLYNNPAVDQAMVAAREMSDTTERDKAWQDINKQIGADIPVAPVVFYRNNFVGSDRIHSFTYGPMGLPYFDKTWLTNGGK